MSYRAAIKSIYNIISACPRTVEPDLPFFTVEDPDSGYVLPVDEVLDPDVQRAFDIRLATPPVDDGGSGYVYTRFRVGLELRVRYSANPRSMAETMVAEDVALLVNALVHPDGWDESIDTIPPPGAPQLEELLNEDGAIVGLLLTLPFEMLYRAS